MKSRVVALLDEFYNNRIVSEEVRLEADSFVLGEIRLLSHGWEVQEEEKDEDERKRRLGEFQSEMQDFTEFLKVKFFNG